MNKVVVYKQDGTVSFLYSDGHPALELGKATIKRASDVFFDEDRQEWRVHIRGEREPLNEGFAKRQDAIDFEVNYLNQKLQSG